MPDTSTESTRRQQKFGLKRPRKALRVFEMRALLEAWSLFPTAPWLLSQPRGDRRRVMTIPGYLADDISMQPLRSYLSYLGYQPLPWTLGRNRGAPEKDARLLIRHLATLKDADQPITLIGWSLGGVIAREVARNEPDLVREVITMGTPVEGGPKYTVVGERFARQQNMDLDSFERRVHEINLKGISQPLTVIYSRTDAIVGWQAAIDRYNPHARHVKVFGSHIGMGMNPRVWREIARTLHRSKS